MRKLLALLVLVPFVAVAVLSCDDHPTSPEEAQAATTALAAQTTREAKGPPSPPAVPLSDYSWVSYVGSSTATAFGTTVRCPEGTNSIAGGGICFPPARYIGDMPTKIGAGPPAPPFGWVVWCENPTGAEVSAHVSAVCVESVPPDAE